MAKRVDNQCVRFNSSSANSECIFSIRQSLGAVAVETVISVFPNRLTVLRVELRKIEIGTIFSRKQ
jgi:hypothetical protein